MKSIVSAGVLGLAGLFLVSCSASRSTSNSFLTSYKGFKQESQFSNAVIYTGDAGNLKDYHSIFLEEVRVFPPQNMEKKEVTRADLARLQRSFRKDLEKQIRLTKFKLVSGRGKGTLALRAGVTDITPGDPAIFAMGYVPYVGTATTAARVLTGSKMGAGAATVEAEMLDSVTRERMFAIIDEEVGNSLEVVEGMSRWGHIEKAFEDWSKGLREKLQGMTQVNN